MPNREEIQGGKETTRKPWPQKNIDFEYLNFFMQNSTLSTRSFKIGHEKGKQKIVGTEDLFRKMNL